MSPGMWIEIRTILVIAVLLIIPGWAILAVSGLWKRWQDLQRWFMAIGVSIAFYPVLFYLMRTLLPSVQMGRKEGRIGDNCGMVIARLVSIMQAFSFQPELDE